MRHLAIVLSLLLLMHCEKTFFETPNTYIQYRHWIVSERGILIFQFQTFKQNALLLYTDGGPGSKDFLKLQLINEKLVVNTNFGSGTETFELGESLSNGVFHSVQVNVEAGLLTVYLDQSYSKEKRFDNSAADNILQIQTAVFIGGVNKFYTAEMVEKDLALEPRFTGCIKGLQFTRTDGETFGTPRAESEEGTKDGCEDTVCDNLSFTDSCKNGGRCEAQIDGGYHCNCERTGYSGEKCTTAATVAKFQASEYIRYVAQDDPIVSKYDSLSFRLKTSRANGLVFYYRTDNFFMSVEIVNNEISLNTGFSTRQQLVTLDNSFFISDNEWHEVRIGRYESFVTLEVDGTQKSDRLANPTLVKYNKEMFIGGGESLTQMEGVRSKLNFVGCLQQLTFNKMQMLKDAKSETLGYSTHGRVEWMCSDIQYVPVTFGSSEAKLELDPWMLNRELSLQFKTSNPDGVIAFTGTDATYLAIQLVQGSLVFNAKKNGVLYEALVGSNLADSNWHSLTARYDTEGINIHIYGDVGNVQENSDRFNTKGDLDIRSPLILGDAGMYNSLFNSGYKGCIRGFSIQQEVIDLYTKLVNRPPGVVAGCGSLEEACSIQPCYHGSVCHQEMNSFTCDCTGTGYEGSVCSKEAKSLTFSGAQYLRQLTGYPVSHDEDRISFRFRTQVQAGLIMFITTDTFNEKYVFFEVVNSKLYVIVHYGVQKFFLLEPLVSDGRWHVVQFNRIGNSITLSLDHTEVKYTYPGDEVQFPYQYAYLGSAPETEWKNVRRMTKSRTAFDGCIQQVKLNGEDLIGSEGANIIKNARPNCKFQETTDQQIAAFVRHTYLRLPPWTVAEAAGVSSLNFNFRTMESNGMIMFHGDTSADYVAVELVQGRLKTTLTIGDGTRTVSSLIGGLNDNAWHSVILEITPSSFTLEVDGTPMQQPLTEADFAFSGGLFVGGLPENMDMETLSYSIQENPSFLGCIKALIVNDVIQDLLQAGNGKSGVRSECEGTCAAYPCQNGGSCRQLETQFDCLCSGTFFKGKTCSEEMALVRFTPGSTLRYTFYEHKTTIRDDLHIKFKTQNTDGGLVQVQTGDPNKFIKLQIKETYLELTMKIGQERVFARSPAPVNDDMVHTLSFWRRNTGVSYTFDGGDVLSSNLEAVGTLEFGVIMTILLSFPVNNMQFAGCIMGFDYNGITPLENMALPNIAKSPGVVAGSCDLPGPVVTPEPDEEEEESDNNSGDNNNTDNNTDNEETDTGDSNEIDTKTKPPYNKNSTTSQTHTEDNDTSLGLPIIIVIALGGFLLILVIIYGVSRFARRRQGVYKTNEDKRAVADPLGQRVEYDKLTIHEEAFELPSKELYM